MLTLGLAVFLAMLSVASFPCWSYSKRWGYVPCTTTAIILFFVAMIAVGGKPAAGETRVATVPPSSPAIPASPAPAPTHGYIIDSSRQPISPPRHGGVELGNVEPVSGTAEASLQQ